MHKRSLHELLQLAQSNSLLKSKRKAYFGSKWDKETVYAAKIDNHLLVIGHIHTKIYPKKRSGGDPYFQQPHLHERCMIAYQGDRYIENLILTLEGKIRTATGTTTLHNALHKEVRYQLRPGSPKYRQAAHAQASPSR
jgi:hypothetical protein